VARARKAAYSFKKTPGTLGSSKDNTTRGVPLDVAQFRVPRHVTTDEIVTVEPDPDNGHLWAFRRR